ncbi:BTAD domain-containing putative transcriptional regulator [Kitasatospora sp. NPDC057936]|uniref:AfsR/SARP family transcriptional regulator n=1 Tax=Kitasatospora sp. NPDC057936 TaxID=3346283 RepID=UPI0036DD7000
MPITTPPPSTTTITARPADAALGPRERDLLYAVGCGLKDDEIAAALAIPPRAVAGLLARLLARLGLPDRTAAVVHAFDSGLVSPGHGPRRRTTGPTPADGTRRTPGPPLRISLLGPLRAWHDGRPLDLGHLRQQAVLTALALRPGRAVSQRELVDGVWGEEPPGTKVVPVYVYRLRKALRTGGGPHAVIASDRDGYRLVPGTVAVDVARMEDLRAAAGTAERAGDLPEAVRLCALALDLFRGEPLAGQPGPLAEQERLRLTEHRTALAQRKLGWQLRLGRHREAVAELSALAEAQPLNEPVAAMLMHALYLGGRQADALAVFDRTRRRLRDDLAVHPGQDLRRVHRMILHGDVPAPAP